MNLVRDIFAPIKKIVGADNLSTTAVSKAINGDSITVIAVSGNVWINPLGTAVADATSIGLTTGTQLNLVVSGSLSLISDSSGASYRIIHWGV
jgi:hypothetical protein